MVDIKVGQIWQNKLNNEFYKVIRIQAGGLVDLAALFHDGLTNRSVASLLAYWILSEDVLEAQQPVETVVTAETVTIEVVKNISVSDPVYATNIKYSHTMNPYLSSTCSLCQDCGLMDGPTSCPFPGTRKFAAELESLGPPPHRGTKLSIPPKLIPVYEGLRTGVASLMCPVFGVRR